MMRGSYEYPLDSSWTREEIVCVMKFYNQIENYYESQQKIDSLVFLEIYRLFKQIVPSKSQEKQLDQAFEKASGYSTYQAVQSIVKAQKK